MIPGLAPFLSFGGLAQIIVPTPATLAGVIAITAEEI